MTLRELIESVPDVDDVVGFAAKDDVSAEVARAIDESVAYLGSDVALDSLAADSYWPKWDSPWWHALLLWELDETARIPQRAIDALVAAVDALPVKIFPIYPTDAPEGTNLWRDTSCHCALGSVAQVAVARGVDVDRVLPWIAPWFPRYQMADGGLNCDGDAYLQAGEVPSSMVGTVAPLEAMLLAEPATWSTERRQFVDRAAAFLIARRLMLGSQTAFNAEERVAAESWLQPCFPRFYFYDVLRGLRALARWAVITGGTIPPLAVEAVVEHLARSFPDGVIRIRRDAVSDKTTLLRGADGTWTRGHPASSFALLDATSRVGAPSPTLTRHWRETRKLLLRVDDSGQLAR